MTHLPGLELAAARLAAVAGLPTPVVVADACDTCALDGPEGRAVVLVAPAPHPAQLGMLAHEVAHLAGADRPHQRAATVALLVGATVAGLAALVAADPVGALTVWALALLVATAARRRGELACDRAGAWLLDAIGLDGAALTRTALTTGDHPAWLDVLAVVLPHPSTRARLTALDQDRGWQQ